MCVDVVFAMSKQHSERRINIMNVIYARRSYTDIEVCEECDLRMYIG